jgi:hypothetical protein
MPFGAAVASGFEVNDLCQHPLEKRCEALS